MKLVYALFASLLIVSCSPKTNESETEQMAQRIQELEAQLEECQNNDNRLLDRTIAAYHNEDYDSVKILYAQLQQLYPELHDLREAMDIHYEVIQEESASIREITAKEEASKRATEKLKQAIEKLKLERIGGTALYTSTTFTHFNDRDLMSIYISKKGNARPILFVKLSYKGNDWIHFKKASLSSGNTSIDIPFDAFEHKETKKDAGVSEWIEVPVKENVISFLRPFAKSISAKMKLDGKHSETRTLSAKERQAIIEVLDGYDALKASN